MSGSNLVHEVPYTSRDGIPLLGGIQGYPILKSDKHFLDLFVAGLI